MFLHRAYNACPCAETARPNNAALRPVRCTYTPAQGAQKTSLSPHISHIPVTEAPAVFDCRGLWHLAGSSAGWPGTYRTGPCACVRKGRAPCARTGSTRQKLNFFFFQQGTWGPAVKAAGFHALFTALFIIGAGAENAGSRLEGVRMCNAAQNKRDANDAHPGQRPVFSLHTTGNRRSWNCTPVHKAHKQEHGPCRAHICALCREKRRHPPKMCPAFSSRRQRMHSTVQNKRNIKRRGLHGTPAPGYRYNHPFYTRVYRAFLYGKLNSVLPARCRMHRCAARQAGNACAVYKQALPAVQIKSVLCEKRRLNPASLYTSPMAGLPWGCVFLTFFISGSAVHGVHFLFSVKFW